MLSENVMSEKAFSDHPRSGFLVPHQKSRFLISFSNSIRLLFMPSKNAVGKDPFPTQLFTAIIHVFRSAVLMLIDFWPIF